MTLEEMRIQIGKWLREPDGGRLWDLMCAQRGPDAPSERPSMDSSEQAAAYSARRKRKFDTVEVIRANSWGGVVGGAARSHHGDTVTLPPRNEWDHFDVHVERAAAILGLKMVVGEPRPIKGVAVEDKPRLKLDGISLPKPGSPHTVIPTPGYTWVQAAKAAKAQMNAALFADGKAKGKKTTEAPLFDDDIPF